MKVHTSINVMLCMGKPADKIQSVKVTKKYISPLKIVNHEEVVEMVIAKPDMLRSTFTQRIDGKHILDLITMHTRY